MDKGYIGIKIDLDDEGEFEVSALIGHGAFGFVYSAVNMATSKIVAVKFLPIDNDSDAPAVALLNEAKSASIINHPNVIRVLKVNTDLQSPPGPYIVMEYASGGTLSNFLKKQKAAKSVIPLPHAAEMMLNIAQGTKAINDVLIHRDIKPDNILLDDNRLKISDFGISKFIDEQTRLPTFKGRQHVWYMAPEAWTLEKNTFKLDVYSVGLVFYEILTLLHPLSHFIADTSDFEQWKQAHLFSQCEDVRKYRPEVGLHWAQLLQKMVAKNVDDRPGWDEIIKIIEGSGELHSSIVDTSKAIEAALTMKQRLELKRLEAKKIADEKANCEKFAELARQNLFQRIDEVVDQFNKNFQFGSIKSKELTLPPTPGRVHPIPKGKSYSLPEGIHYLCVISAPLPTPLKMPNYDFEIMGLGYLGPQGQQTHGKSGNLLWVRSPNNIYGEWKILLVSKINDPTARYEKYVDQPFGFIEIDALIAHLKTSGDSKVLSFDVRDQIESVFVELLESAFLLSVKS